MTTQLRKAKADAAEQSTQHTKEVEELKLAQQELKRSLTESHEGQMAELKAEYDQLLRDANAARKGAVEDLEQVRMGKGRRGNP